jgi:type I restriction enzyme M protein
MSLTKSYVKQFLRAINYTPIDGSLEIWERLFTEHNKYKIKVDLSNTEISQCKINYGESIKADRNTTVNFSQSESLVVLECVTRLLDKGYHPKSIHIEKNWKGHGYVDIMVNDNNGDAYLMIECKQWGKEHNAALKIILQNNTAKEQLFNYYKNEKTTKFLTIYSSRLNENNYIEYRNDIINSEPFKGCNNQKEIYEKWDKTFQAKGIFEDNINPYNIKFLGLLKSDLKTLDASYVGDPDDVDGSIYNRFAEILRRHTVSDKNNSYNKIFNLFLCKIVDEDNASENDELLFQWREKEPAIDVLGRLNDLYKQGMKDYLKLDVADVSEEEFDSELSKLFRGADADDTKIREMFQLLRLYKNNEFAFKEVIDERTFKENAEVVKEVVKLLEPFKIKYSHKHQFLGEFFERLLNIGVKQEAGQFFTPIPIASFICNSIDFEGIIQKKIIRKEPNFLPYIIDYACGSGHFLTEVMDRVDKVLQNVEGKELPAKLQKDNAIGWKVSYKWASEFVYGIEKDYRLAKTTKVASFLNGDGEANVIYGDGLDSFDSPFYINKLRSNGFGKDNANFDVVIANPPYSVQNFKLTLHNSKDSFELYKDISDKSDDIECLFIERTKQLLKVGGVAGIILPSTILLNEGVYQKAREIILKYFEIYGVVEFGKNTFAATGQNTVILFLKRREDSYWIEAKKLVDKFFKEKVDFAFGGQENIVSSFLLECGTTSFVDYIKEVDENSKVKLESTKLLFYLLTFNQTVIVGHSGDKIDDEKHFLGYEHSDMKRYEGIHPYPYNSTGKIISMLYDNESFDNPDKLSSFILKNFKGEQVSTIPESLKKHIVAKKLCETIDFPSDDFKYRIYVKSLQNQFAKTTKYRLVTLGDSEIAQILDHLRKPVKRAKRTSGKYPYYGATRQNGQIDDFIFDEKLVLIGEDGAFWKRGHNTAYIIDGKSWVNNHAHVVRPNTNQLTHEFLKEIFFAFDFSYLKSRPNGGKLLRGDLVSIKFPLPTISEQQEILTKLVKLEKVERADFFDKLLGVD